MKAATLSLQLYVHRIGLNLEQTEEELGDNPDGLTRIDSIKRGDIDDEGWQEWVWLKNYRVWEANRKVFLYLENYLEPDFRDDRSPQFKALADELLQVELTEDSVEQAYKTYLTQFEKLAQLRIAGAYFDDNEDTLYVFGISSNKECYWRKFVRQVHWTPWEKIDFPVDSLYVSPIKYRGKLYLFWLQARVQELTKFEGGTSRFSGFVYHQTLHYSYLNSDERWSVSKTIQVEHRIESDEINPWERRALERRHTHKVFTAVDKQDSTIHLVLGANLNKKYSTIFDKKYRLNLYKNRLESYTGKFGDKFFGYALDSNGMDGIQWIDIGFGWFDNEIDLVKQADSHFNSSEKLIPTTKQSEYDFEYDVSINYRGNSILHINDIPYLLRNKPTYVDLIKNETKGLAAIAESIVNALFTTVETARNLLLNRLTTTLLPQFQDTLYNRGLHAFLSLTTQQAKEVSLPFDVTYNKLTLPSTEAKLDFKGAMGTYFSELFFHIPFKIAHQLNANQRFREAQQWLHYIFNPLPETSSDDPKANFWQYIEFRGHDMQTLREQLTDEAAIEEYKRDPFNPFTIARLRLSAFQKAVFMKYVDNLIDWGDYLFAQDTMESINEANLLYIMASDLLGARPVPVGACKVALEEDQRTYESIKKTRVSEFLYEMEQVEVIEGKTFTGRDTTGEEYSYRTSTVHLYAQLPVFCVPENKQLLGYWDRVEDRLHKVRNCMNIKGVRRQLALFQPPIDPAMLVRARAAGLSIEEIVDSVNSPLPLYRFSYLLERAKAYTAQVQSFGSSLLSLLERKDAATLTLLLSEQQQELQQETRKIKERRLDEVAEQYAAWEIDQKKQQLRQAYLTQLASENNEDGSGIGGQYGMSNEEKNQIAMLIASTVLKATANGVNTAASIAYAIPQVGAPTALHYGGIQLGSILSVIGSSIDINANVADMEGTRSSLVGGYKRRHQEWIHQLELLEQEKEQLAIQKKLLDIRQEVAEQDLLVFDRSVEQTQELYEFHRSKFTNQQLYSWMLTETQKMYRESYRTAQEMAKLAEEAYHFERDEDQGSYVKSDHWDSSHKGLLAGERLSLQLQRMERAYLENDQRYLEIDQAFSLRQIDPEKLLTLRSSGQCTFTVPEFLFDLTYPGHYRRKIKSVRLTIPCITGPYTNVGVTLTLIGSKIRMVDRIDPDMAKDEKLKIPVPRAKNDSIATSTAQNDGGQFTLDFNGARYLPFEGAGAVESTWKIDLPDQFRPFDYDTIADVLIHVSYTAKSGIDRKKVNGKLQEVVEGAAVHRLRRVMSLQQEFSGEFHRLLHRPLGEAIIINVQRKHFPFFLQSAKKVKVSAARLFLHTSGDIDSIAGFKVTIDDTTFDKFQPQPSVAKNLFVAGQSFVPSQELSSTQDTIPVTVSVPADASGDLITGTDDQRINADLLKDVILLIDYRADF